ncbi:MAG: hypothetical protein ACOX3S_09025 [Anaerolineae bacterium]|jgi:hypothetical protein
MGLFGKRNKGQRCPDCKHYVMVEGYGYCAKAIPDSVNVRMLSGAGLKRQCPRCPDQMTCSDWTAK